MPSADELVSTKSNVPLPGIAAVTSYSIQLSVLTKPRSPYLVPTGSGRLFQVTPASVHVPVERYTAGPSSLGLLTNRRSFALVTTPDIPEVWNRSMALAAGEPSTAGRVLAEKFDAGASLITCASAIGVKVAVPALAVAPSPARSPSAEIQETVGRGMAPHVATLRVRVTDGFNHCERTITVYEKLGERFLDGIRLYWPVSRWG